MFCAFRQTGFVTAGGVTVRPCGTVYCSGCIEAGEPFKTRRLHKKGLKFPKVNTLLFPNYICEACQVRAHLNREIQLKLTDYKLLMLERMRQLDTVSEWAEETVSKCGGKVKRFLEFEQEFGIGTLIATQLERPPSTPAMPIIWDQLNASLRAGKDPGSTITYGTTRSMRSAAGFYYGWDLQQAFPGNVAKVQRRHLFSSHVPPPEELASTLQSSGMARRMGTGTKQSWALQWVHVKFIDDQLEHAWNTALDDSTRREIANAGTCNLTLWLGMFRGGENFNLCRSSVKIVLPRDGPSVGLPAGVGMVEMRLTPETKSSPNKTADMVIAFTCASGLSIGKWMLRALSFPDTCDNDKLFSSDNMSEWDSSCFRHTYLWPLLELQRVMGEATLKAFSEEKGKTIRAKVWSCHSYRRGFTAFVLRKRKQNLRRASADELRAHARWERAGRTSTDMVEHYSTDMDTESRVDFTLRCG